MSYASVTVFEIPATQDYPAKIECKPYVIELLEQALSNSISEEVIAESLIPDAYAKLLRAIAKNSLEAGVYLIEKQLRSESEKLSKVIPKTDISEKKIEAISSTTSTYIIKYLSVLSKVLPNYVKNACVSLRAKNLNRLNIVELNFNRYLQWAYMLDSSLSLAEFGFLEKAVGICGASLEMACVLDALKGTRLDAILDSIKLNRGEVLSVNITTGKLQARNIISENVKLRLVKRQLRSNVREIDVNLDFLSLSANEDNKIKALPKIPSGVVVSEKKIDGSDEETEFQFEEQDCK